MCFSRSTEPGQEIAELERRMRVNDMIMRYITVRVDEDRKKADKITAKREAAPAKRARFRHDGTRKQQERTGRGIDQSFGRKIMAEKR